MERPLNVKNDFEKYYLINFKWIKKYLELTNMNQIYNALLKENIIQNIINNDINNNLTKDKIIKKVTSKIEPKLIQKIHNNEQIHILKNNQLSDISFSHIIKENKKYLAYYYNFIILAEETINSLFDLFCFNIKESNSFHILYGDNKIFIDIRNKNQYTLEIGNLDNNYIFIPNLFLDYSNQQNFGYGLYLLKNKGYNPFIQDYMFLSNDYFSPIFYTNNNIIGNAYKYDSSIYNYTKYTINNHLKNMIKLYLNQFKLKAKFKMNYIKPIKFYLTNKKHLEEYKNFFDYSILENQLKQKVIITQILKSFENNYNKEENLINDKKIILIIKYLPPEINSNYNENEKYKLDKYKNNEQELPLLQTYNFGSDYLFYYNDFSLINESIYNLIYGINKFSQITNEKENYCSCFFINNHILIDISKNNSIKKFILEACIFNENMIYPKYLLLFENKQDFLKYINYFNQEIGLNNFLEGLSFSQNYIYLYANNDEKIGTIFDISNVKPGPNPLPLPSPSPSPTPHYISIKEEFPFPPLIGLQNVGATCYMNATLQCFCQIEKLVSYFKYNQKMIDIINKKFFDKKSSCLTYSFKYLVENLWPSNNKYFLSQYNHKNSNNKYFAPYKFKEKISNMNPLFAGAQANDSKDLVNFIVMTLHEELNKAPKYPNQNNNVFQIDQTNSLEILNSFILNFANENQSIISDIFYGVSHTGTQCSGCKITKYNYQAYFFLIFPLEEIRKSKIQQMQNQILMQNMMAMNNPLLLQQNMINMQNLQNINSVNIYDCFNYNEKFEYFQGENSMYCNNCKQQLPASYQTTLYTTPEILILVLNRGKGIEFRVKLEFYEDLNLMKYVKMQNTGVQYKLIGVVTHLGESGASGHFIAYCKSPISLEWYQYNDDLVTPVVNFKQQIIDYAMPYILFYQKTDGIK